MNSKPGFTFFLLLCIHFCGEGFSFSQSNMPAAIKISPANATAWDQITLTFDPAKACSGAGKSLVGSPKVMMHGAAFLYANIASWPTWGQLAVNFDQLPKDGIHKTTDLKANPDGTFSITLVPAKFFGASEGTTIIGLSLVFNNGTWNKEGKDGTGSCTDFYVPLKYKDPVHQASQAFRYQGVARNADGTGMINKTIRLRVSILQGSDAGTSVYSESHSVATNAFGLFSLEIGKGTPLTGNFSAIDWSTGAYFLKTEMDPANGTSYQAMGVSQLLSVPYALYAENAGAADLSWANSTNGMTTLDKVGIGTNEPTGMLAVQGTYAIPSDTALFSVKDKTGNVIFAVYEDGAELFVKEGAKGGRGGFAVGGRTAAKGAVPLDILRVTPDSIRFYVNELPGAKGSRGGFAVSGRSAAKAAAATYTSLTKDNYFIGESSGSKINGGKYNSVLGFQAGSNITAGSDNAFLGYQAGYSNSTGSGNLFLGYQTGYSNKLGNFNSFLGYKAGFSNTTGINNTFLGDSAGYFNISGNSNTFIGTRTGVHNTTGYNNAFLGNFSGYSNTIGWNNFFIGNLAGFNNTVGVENIFIGNESGYSSRSGWGNVYLGFQSGRQTTTGGANTFVGTRTGYSNTIGFANTFIGLDAGYSLDSGCCNTFLGDHAGYFPVSSTENVFLGAYAGYNLSKSTASSSKNVFIGNYAGNNSIAGYANIFIGTRAAYSNIQSDRNVFLGYESGFSNLTGSDNVFLGNSSAYYNTTGFFNVIIGNRAGFSNTTGYENTFIGHLSGWASKTAIGNVFLGTYAGRMNARGINSVIIGIHAGELSNGSNNTIVGAWSAVDDTLGSNNVIVGSEIARRSTGSRNVYIGNYTAFNSTTGNDNVFIGNGAGYLEITGSNKLFIDNTGTPDPLLWGDFSARQLVINGHSANGKVFFVNGAAGGTTTWAQVSDARLKKNIVSIPNALDKVMKLQGVNYEWIDPAHFEPGLQMGFIAQETEKVIPEVVRKDGDNYMMQYAPIIALLAEGMKDQQKQIEKAKQENLLLKQQNEELLKRIEHIENLLK